jgi:hypothetical protein
MAWANVEGKDSEKREQPVRLITSLALRVHVEAALQWQPERGERSALMLVGSVHLPEIRAGIQFHGSDGGNGGGGPGASQAVAVVVPRHKRIAWPDRDLVIPARNPSDVWVITPALDPGAPWIERYGGRLGDGPLAFDVYLTAAVTLDVTFTPERYTYGSGFAVNFSGDMRLDQSLPMRLQFRDPMRPAASTSESPGHETVLLRAGSRIPIPPQPVSRLSSHDPFMTVRVFETPGQVVRVAPPTHDAGQIAS